MADSNELSPIDTELLPLQTVQAERINEPDSDSGHEDNNQEL